MKLAEYIEHLQSLQKQYAGLDIEVAQRHPTVSTNAGLYVVPAKAPRVWPVRTEDSHSQLVPLGAQPLDPAAKPKGPGPHGVILVFDVQ
ncbi:hypothetical protein P3T24_003985 [Paraburkholderia sp. GAS33]|jgi:hypothetical protein|uniref:Uncharacterized protein n=1 Tax=Paraburkholderia phenazinium TaxID=60549 RepID=A0A1N6K1B5_9BURK|nr:hypothetical protein SAMN05444165_2984 [Paraburkholderia phenazinium]SIO50137.1 hypothetical protein SAMN05444168_5673 [Paraburkholderia phenazinium]